MKSVTLIMVIKDDDVQLSDGSKIAVSTERSDGITSQLPFDAIKKKFERGIADIIYPLADETFLQAARDTEVSVKNAENEIVKKKVAETEARIAAEKAKAEADAAAAAAEAEKAKVEKDAKTQTP